ncbi:MAG: PqqD family protein [Bacteroides sp.]|nr:PqqD family protein [Bacteroides sp.]MCM1447135.1 PqqD family protein [Bacteroides sp.]MCM1515133.1 PqqD family protein [Paraprevotella sp.]
MKVKEGFQLREVCGEFVVVASGVKNIDFSQVIHFNKSAATIWKAVCQQEFTPEDMARILTDEYEVPAATALEDATRLAEQWKEIGIAE